MKNRTFNFLMLPLFVFSFQLSAQNPVKSFKEDYNWNNVTEIQTIIIDVKKEADIIEIEFEGNITGGSLEVTAFDPEGNKVAGFSLVASGEESANVIVETTDDDGSYAISNTNSNSNSNSDSDGTSQVSVTTGSGSNSSSVKIKSKNKNKNKSGKGYSVVSTSSDSRSAKGMMKKKLSDPMPGNWKFVLSIENVTGTLMADIEQG